MERILPSEKMRKELREMIRKAQESRFSVSDLVRRLAGLIVQEMMEQEVTDFLGGQRYERSGQEVVHKGHRNCDEPLTIRTGDRLSAPGERHVRRSHTRGRVAQ
jgi:transposase-like protein